MNATLEELTGKPHISYSGFTTWLECGEKFRLQRIKGVQEQPGYYLAGGSAVHHATEVYDQGADVTTAIQAFHNYFDEELAQRPNAVWRAAGRKTAQWPQGEDDKWWRANGPDMVRKYAQFRINTNATFPIWQTEAGLEGIELPVDPEFTGGIQLKGYIDRVFTMQPELVVVDLKSGSREPASALQLGVYATAMEKQYGIRPKWGAYYMTRKGEMTPMVDLSHYTEEKLARWFRSFKRAVESDIFVPHVTSMCSGCGVREACYAYSPGVQPDFDLGSDLGT